MANLNITGDLTINGIKATFVKESYLSDDGTTMYRLWSDGWCEQWVTISPGTNRSVTLTIPKAYKDIYSYAAWYADTGDVSSTNTPQYTSFNLHKESESTVTAWGWTVTRKVYFAGWVE